jgi:beta-lactam-binding protein with PASTA domain
MVRSLTHGNHYVMTQPPEEGWPTLDEPTLVSAPPTPPPQPAYPPPPDRRIGAGMVLALAALALTAAGIALAWFITHRNSNPSPTTVVVTTTAATSTGAGAPATTVAKRPAQRQFSAPSLVGQQLADAQHKLAALGLHVLVTQVASSQPAGTVVDQAPKPGAKLQKGWDVVLSVARSSSTTTQGTSTGATTTSASTTAPTTTAAPLQPTSATVPDVSNQTEQAAVTALNRAGILASLFFVPSSDPLGTVEQQAKPSGTTLPYHSHVQINISTGPGQKAQEQVPNVVGRTLHDAVSALNGAQLRLIYVKFPVTSGRVGVVVQQSPLAGGHAPQNAQVLVFLAVKR